MKSETMNSIATTSTKRYMNVKEAAQYMGVSVRYFRNLLAERAIKKIRIGRRRIMVRSKDVDEYMDSLVA